MIVVAGQFRFPAERMAEAWPVMHAVITATRAEAGCVLYAYAEDVLDPGLIRVSELWQSRAQLDAHMQTPHMATWQRARTALGLSERAITVYETDAGTAL